MNKKNMRQTKSENKEKIKKKKICNHLSYHVSFQFSPRVS